MDMLAILAAPKPLFLPASEVLDLMPEDWRHNLHADGFYKIEAGDTGEGHLVWYWSATPWQN